MWDQMWTRIENQIKQCLTSKLADPQSFRGKSRICRSCLSFSPSSEFFLSIFTQTFQPNQSHLFFVREKEIFFWNQNRKIRKILFMEFWRWFPFKSLDNRKRLKEPDVREPNVGFSNSDSLPECGWLEKLHKFQFTAGFTFWASYMKLNLFNKEDTAVCYGINLH